MGRLANKVALITGAAGGIGLETAKLFLGEGAKVVLVDLDAQVLEKAVAELGSPNASFVAADVSKAADVEKYVRHTVDTFGKIDVFFNNAGIEGEVKPIEEATEENFDRVLAVNVKGVWLGMKHVLPQMNDGGSIINTSSVAGLIGSLSMAAYVASKHAVIGLTRTAALEVAPRKIRVNSVHPGPVDNRMMRSLEEGYAPGDAESVKKGFEARVPLASYSSNLDIANAVLYLASDESRLVTGTKLVVDGGMTMP